LVFIPAPEGIIPSLPAGFQPVGRAFWLHLINATGYEHDRTIAPGKPLTINLPLSAAILAQVDNQPKRLYLAVYDEDSSAWMTLETAPQDGELQARGTRLGLMTLVARPASSMRGQVNTSPLISDISPYPILTIGIILVGIAIAWHRQRQHRRAP
jgi:hypothetical protein